MALLAELCAIPKLFDLPIVTGFVDRQVICGMHPADSVAENTLNALVATAVRCTLAVERYMRKESSPGEVATMIYENNDLSKKLIKEVHQELKKARFGQHPDIQHWDLRELLPIQRVVDTAYFAEKTETSILQVADACVFAMRRHVAEHADAAPLFDLIRGQLSTAEPAR
jgi:hypothetical protein